MAGLDFSGSAKPVQQTGLDFSQGASPVDQDEITLSDTLGGALRNVGQGLSLGFSDELIAGAEAAGRAALFDEDFDTAFEAAVGRERQSQEGFAERNPFTAGALQFGGAAIPTLATAGAAAAPTLAGAIGRGALAGAGGGAAFGAGTAEGGITERAIPAAVGGAVGSLTGGAAAPLLRGAGRGISAIGRQFGRDAPTGAQAGAQRIIREDLASAGLTPERATQQIQQLRQQGVPARLGDIAPNLQTQVESIAKQPGPGGAALARQLSSRARLQNSRLTGQLAKATGVAPREIDNALAQVNTRRSAQAKPLYDAAFSANVPASLADDFADLTATGFGKQALSNARKTLQTEFRTADIADVPIMNRIDATKRALDDMIGSAKRSGKNDRARTLTNLKNDLVSSADEANPAYKLARDAWAGPSSYLDAVSDGRQILSKNVSPGDLSRNLADMSASEREGLRVGAVQRILEEFGEKGGAEPDLTKVLNKPNVIKKLKALLPGDAGRGLEQAIKEEARLATTSARIPGGSRTQQLKAAEQRQAAQAQIFDFITSLKTGNLGTSIIQAMNIPAALKTRFLQGRRDEIARLLATRDPAAALRQQRSPNLGLERVAPAIAGPLGGAAGALTQ